MNSKKNYIYKFAYKRWKVNISKVLISKAEKILITLKTKIILATCTKQNNTFKVQLLKLYHTNKDFSITC